MSGATSYVRRIITLTFAIGTGNGGTGTPQTFTVTGLRASIDITKGPTLITDCKLRVRGLTDAQMKSLSTLGMLPTAQRHNAVTIQAGDATTGMFQIYSGFIQSAWVDHANDPDTIFNVAGNPASFYAVNPAPPLSFTGSADVATIMSGLASAMGVQFENNGVNVKISRPYFPGTLYQQVQRAAEAANINYVLDNGVLAIWPQGAARVPVGTTPLISPATGLIGYPTFTSTGVSLRTLFNPAIRPGSTVQVQSSLQPACGKWTATLVRYQLESEMPQGAWFQELLCVRPWLAPLGVIAQPPA